MGIQDLEPPSIAHVVSYEESNRQAAKRFVTDRTKNQDITPEYGELISHTIDSLTDIFNQRQGREEDIRELQKDLAMEERFEKDQSDEKKILAIQELQYDLFIRLSRLYNANIEIKNSLKQALQSIPRPLP